MRTERETLQGTISDWMVFIFGWAVVLFQGYKYFFNKFEGADWWLEIAVFLIGILFIWKPQTLVNLVTKVAKRKSEGI